jgi:hypothetical protein
MAAPLSQVVVSDTSPKVKRVSAVLSIAAFESFLRSLRLASQTYVTGSKREMRLLRIRAELEALRKQRNRQ